MTYIKCVHSGRFFHANNFPKTCNCCGRVFTDREHYVRDTNHLERGQYGCAKNDKVLEFRNCNCGSTLVIQFKDERDYTPRGLHKREWIATKIRNFVEDGHTYSEAKEKALKEFEGLS